jgi:hypothetical protein
MSVAGCSLRTCDAALIPAASPPIITSIFSPFSILFRESLVDDLIARRASPNTLTEKYLSVSEHLEQRGNFTLDLGWLRGWRVTFHNIAVPINEKFGEIPFNRTAAEETRALIFEENIEWMGIGSIHIYFGKHGKGHPVVETAEIHDLFFGSGFLSTKLVAGKTQYNQPLVNVLTVQHLKTVILPSEAALASDIDYQHDLTLIKSEFDLLALNCRDLNIVNFSHF